MSAVWPVHHTTYINRNGGTQQKLAPENSNEINSGWPLQMIDAYLKASAVSGWTGTLLLIFYADWSMATEASIIPWKSKASVPKEQALIHLLSIVPFFCRWSWRWNPHIRPCGLITVHQRGLLPKMRYIRYQICWGLFYGSAVTHLYNA